MSPVVASSKFAWDIVIWSFLSLKEFFWSGRLRYSWLLFYMSYPTAPKMSYFFKEPFNS